MTKHALNSLQKGPPSTVPGLRFRIDKTNKILVLVCVSLVTENLHTQLSYLLGRNTPYKIYTIEHFGTLSYL